MHRHMASGENPSGEADPPSRNSASLDRRGQLPSWGTHPL